MSVPNTMRVGPFVPTILLKKRYLIFYFILIWLSIVPVLLEFWWYWHLLWNWERPVQFFIYLAFIIFGMYVTVVITSVVFAKIMLTLVNWRHKPREGTFLRDVSDKDYRYWCIRNTIKRWPIWIAHKFPFPFLDNVALKAFGVKTSVHNSLFEGWVDTEFLEIGDNVVVGQGSIVQSSVIIGNLLIVRKTVIGNNVRIGSHAFIMPGTKIGDNSVLATNSATTVGQKLAEGWIYVGVPAKKFKKNVFFQDGLEEVLGQVRDVEALRQKYEMIYIKRSDEKLTKKEKKKLMEDRLELEKKRLEEGY